MESVTPSVRVIDTADRQSLEHVLGKHMSENRQVVIHILNSDIRPPEKAEPNQRQPQLATLPDWCSIYEVLSDTEIADIESSIVYLQASRLTPTWR